MKQWYDLSYLLKGDEKQRDVYTAIKDSMLLKLLAAFDPILVGTYPIGIYLEESDIDIICQFFKIEHYESVVLNSFSRLPDFEIKTKMIRGVESMIARFRFDGFKFEIFGQQTAVEEQYAYRHMIIEDMILSERGEGFRKEVLILKEKGLSTEEAFAFLLGIDGDPYDGLLLY